MASIFGSRLELDEEAKLFILEEEPRFDIGKRLAIFLREVDVDISVLEVGKSEVQREETIL